MIRHSGEFRTEIRHEMRGGSGDVKIEHFWEAGKEMLADNRMIAKLTLVPGSSIGFHRHEADEETFVILKGTAEADDNGKKVTLVPGDTMITGGGAGHSLANAGNDTLEVLAFISNCHR